jgi:hypothetical protein
MFSILYGAAIGWCEHRSNLHAGPGQIVVGLGPARPGRAGPGRPDCNRAGPTIERTKTGRAGPGLVTDGPGLKKWARADLYNARINKVQFFI